MVAFTPVLSIWMQLGSFCFSISALFTDILCIRGCLMAAYTMLFVNAVLGAPLWPNLVGSTATQTKIAMDGLIWACIGLYCHLWSFVSLILDERSITLSEETLEAPLWRMFYRTGGLSVRLFRTILSKHWKLVTYKPGQDIPMDRHFYIIYSGQVRLEFYTVPTTNTTANTGANTDTSTTNTNTTYGTGRPKRDISRMLAYRFGKSGGMFGFKHVGHVICRQPIFRNQDIRATVVSKRPVTLFCFEHDDMERISQNPLAKNIWQSLLIAGLSSALESSNQVLQEINQSKNIVFPPISPPRRRLSKRTSSSCSNRSYNNDDKDPENIAFNKENEQEEEYDVDDWEEEEEYVNPIFLPLEKYEMPPTNLAGSNNVLKERFGILRHLVLYGKRSFSWPWLHLTGLRQTSLPSPEYHFETPPATKAISPSNLFTVTKDVSSSAVAVKDATKSNRRGGGGVDHHDDAMNDLHLEEDMTVATTGSPSCSSHQPPLPLPPSPCRIELSSWTGVMTTSSPTPYREDIP